MRFITTIRNTWHRLMSQHMRHEVYAVIFNTNTPSAKLFDVILLWSIVSSIVVVIVESMSGLPPMLKTIFTVLEYFYTFLFTLEYLCRIYCSPTPRQYALSFFGIIDLLSTIPLYIGWLFGPARYLMVVRTFRLIRVFRVFKLFSFLEEGDNLMRSLLLSSRKILVFFLFVVIMVISMGTIMYMVECTVPGTAFTDVPTSIYWAVVTMTTVGYGDIAPVTPVGRFLSAIIMLMGYTIMAVPTGIVSAQFISDQKSKNQKLKCTECGSPLPHNARYCPHCGMEIPIEEAAKALKNVK